MPLFFWDPTMILLIPAIILAMWAQMRVSSTYSKYSKISSVRGTTGADTAKFLLEHNGLSDIKIEAVEGKLSDHYDPRSRTVRLSTDNYQGRSLSAVAVAAHEVGHAIQDGSGYIPLKIRHSILPATNLGSWAAFPLFIIGFLFNTPLLMDIGIILFAGVVVFHLVTLPVEFNASHRALAQLSSNGLLIEEEVIGARKVLNAAAMTYVAATAVSMIHLVRLLILRGND
jgi:Zn-dependent membrane protease YugP